MTETVRTGASSVRYISPETGLIEGRLEFKSPKIERLKYVGPVILFMDWHIGHPEVCPTCRIKEPDD